MRILLELMSGRPTRALESFYARQGQSRSAGGGRASQIGLLACLAPGVGSNHVREATDYSTCLSGQFAAKLLKLHAHALLLPHKYSVLTTAPPCVLTSSSHDRDGPRTAAARRFARGLAECFPQLSSVDVKAEPLAWVAHSIFEARDLAKGGDGGNKKQQTNSQRTSTELGGSQSG